MTEKLKTIQEMIDEIKEKYFDVKHGFTDMFHSGKYVAMQEIQKEIEKWVEDDKLLPEQRVILRQLHGQL